MRVAVIGKGNVGRALAPNIAAAGHNVAFGVRDPHNPKYASQDGIPLKTIGEAVSPADTVILAINWSAVDSALVECGRLLLARSGHRLVCTCLPLTQSGHSDAPTVAIQNCHVRASLFQSE